ncbi:hypothetical protein EVAR_45342_1 [Eumeta japonica]|uniref:Uncharacterized protein n=1 Tax=Eumeta variegata TaxID=151549 RepID=A0A4C1XNZ2_EUMVA|nr:hypothetical protein EVAR_45342_1 [Eumeta japonica]
MIFFERITHFYRSREDVMNFTRPFVEPVNKEDISRSREKALNLAAGAASAPLPPPIQCDVTRNPHVLDHALGLLRTVSLFGHQDTLSTLRRSGRSSGPEGRRGRLNVHAPRSDVNGLRIGLGPALPAHSSNLNVTTRNTAHRYAVTSSRFFSRDYAQERDRFPRDFKKNETYPVILKISHFSPDHVRARSGET